ncbi:putative bifunctional diguanylate cyclase/phosphodiesterase [Roseomonas sp. BN140053]|uniref:putative bifunctional diguanylate cyclase/phosphodiesterase n=1 Tax=Roseomonas sp. BN140053 TaxID=3391898 RepID=UPI0039EB3C5E
MYRVTKHIKAGFLCTAALLTLAAIYTSTLIVQQQTALSDVSRYNVTWLVSQTPFEIARLQATIGTFGIPNSGTTKEDVQLWLEIAASRVETLDAGEARDFIRSSPELLASVEQMRVALASAAPLVATLEREGSAQQLIALLSPLNTRAAKLAVSAYARAGNLVAHDLHQLSQLHWIFSAVLCGLLLCCFSLIAVLAWHNRLLVRTYDEVNALVSDLRRTGQELAEANVRAEHAMREVQQQNEALKASDLELLTQNTRFYAALNNMSQALCMVDVNQQLIVCNIRFLELFGLSVEDTRPGVPISGVFGAMDADTRPGQQIAREIWKEQQALAAEHRQASFSREDQTGRAIAVAHQPMVDGGWVATYEDITQRRQAEAHVQFMAHHDALTGLPNRFYFHKYMGEMLQSEHSGLAVLQLDLDHFKNVNDTLGHPAGDALLKAVAQRLLGCVREGDFVARLGGDEFAILQRGGNQPSQAVALAERIVRVLCEPYNLDGYRAVIGASVGIAVAANSETSADLLLKNADLALYRAKGEGRGVYRFFEPRMDAELQARLGIEADLREALNRDQLEVLYHPVFNFKAGAVTGFEALLRWNHPERGIISPSEFIPIAEEIGMINAIGQWALQCACEAAARWPRSLKLAVNLSPLQFSDEIVATVTRVLAASGLSPARLELEITESALLQDNERVLATLHQLRNLGLKTVLDDFGTGYSSLSYLRIFPFDKIKIDRSFVMEMVRRPDCLAIVNSIASLASKLGMTTTAEGVETLEQFEQVRAAGCTEAQGYLFSRPETDAQIRERWFAPGRTLSVVAPGPDRKFTIVSRAGSTQPAS